MKKFFLLVLVLVLVARALPAAVSTISSVPAVTAPAADTLIAVYTNNGSGSFGLARITRTNFFTTVTTYGSQTNIQGATYWTGFGQPGDVLTWASAGAGNISNDNLAYRVTFYGPDGESFASKMSDEGAVAGERTTVSNIPLSTSPRITGRKLYRNTAANQYVFKLVTTIADNTTTTFADNVAEGSLGATLSTYATDAPNDFADGLPWFNWRRYHVFEFSDSQTEGTRWGYFAPNGWQLLELRGLSYITNNNGILYIAHPNQYDAVSLQVDDVSEDASASDSRITFHFGTNTGKAYRLRGQTLVYGTSDQMQIFSVTNGVMTLGGTNTTKLAGTNILGVANRMLFASKGYSTFGEQDTIHIGNSTNYFKVHTNRTEAGGVLGMGGFNSTGDGAIASGVLSLGTSAQQLVSNSDQSSVTVKAGSASVLEVGNYAVDEVATNQGVQLLSGTYKGNAGGLTNVGGYALELLNLGSVFNPTDGGNYFVGSLISTPGSTYGPAKLQLPKSGKLTRVNLTVNGGGNGSTENVVHSIRINDTTDVATINAEYSTLTTGLHTNNVTVSQSVTAGDFIALKIVSPTWATNPTAVRYHCIVWIE